MKTKISIFLTRAAAGSLLAGLSLIACPSGSGAATEPVIVEAEGEAFLGTYDTPKEVMERARQNALNRAVEKAVGYFIRSHAVVSNFRLAEELTFASVRGRARQVEIIKEGWDERERQVYRVALRAAVDPVYPEKGGGVSLKLWMAKDVLRPGEETKIFYQVDADCYVYLFSVAADGSVTVLFPNSANRDNLARARVAYTFPPPDSAVKLQARLIPEAGEMPSVERIKIIATREKEDLLPLGFREGTFRVYDASSTGMIGDLVKKLNRLEPADWAEATAPYTITK